MNRRYYLFIFYFFLGFTGSFIIHSIRKDLQTYNLPLAVLNNQFIIFYLPWSIKCIFAAAIDFFHCFGMNRKPYLVMGNFFSSLFALFFIFKYLTLQQYVGLQFGLQSFSAWADVSLDALLIDEGNLEGVNKEGEFQNKIRMIRTIGRIVGGTTGPVLWGEIESKGVYIILACVHLICMFLGCLVQDSPVHKMYNSRVQPTGGGGGGGGGGGILSIELDNKGHPINPPTEAEINQPAKVSTNCFFYLGLIKESLYNNRVLRVLLIFNIITGLSPSSGLATFYFLNDIVHITPLQTSLLNLFAELTGLAVIALFELCLKHFPIKYLYFVIGILKFVSGFLPFFLVKEADPGYPKICELAINETTIIHNTTCYFYEQYHTDPFYLALGDNVIGEALDELQSMPLNIVTKTVCYHQLGATIYTFTLAIQNLVSGMRIYLDSYLLLYFGIDHYQFENLGNYILFCSCLDTLWYFIGMFVLPTETNKEVRIQVDEEKARKETELDIRTEFRTNNTESAKEITEFVI